MSTETWQQIVVSLSTIVSSQMDEIDQMSKH